MRKLKGSTVVVPKVESSREQYECSPKAQSARTPPWNAQSQHLSDAKDLRHPRRSSVVLTREAITEKLKIDYINLQRDLHRIGASVDKYKKLAMDKCAQMVFRDKKSCLQWRQMPDHCWKSERSRCNDWAKTGHQKACRLDLKSWIEHSFLVSLVAT